MSIDCYIPSLLIRYEITCQLPPEKVSAMIGPGGQIVRAPWMRSARGFHGDLEQMGDHLLGVFNMFQICSILPLFEQLTREYGFWWQLNRDLEFVGGSTEVADEQRMVNHFVSMEFPPLTNWSILQIGTIKIGRKTSSSSLLKSMITSLMFSNWTSFLWRSPDFGPLDAQTVRQSTNTAVHFGEVVPGARRGRWSHLSIPRHSNAAMLMLMVPTKISIDECRLITIDRLSVQNGNRFIVTVDIHNIS